MKKPVLKMRVKSKVTGNTVEVAVVKTEPTVEYILIDGKPVGQVDRSMPVPKFTPKAPNPDKSDERVLKIADWLVIRLISKNHANMEVTYL